MAAQPKNGDERPPVAASVRPVRRLDATELLAGAREVLLLHEGSEYRLRLTRNRKLILTK